MSRLLPLLLIVLAGCSSTVRYALLGSRTFPTTEGEALIAPRDGGGFDLTVTVDNLPGAARFDEGYGTYVVWVDESGEGGPRVLGPLEVDAQARSGALSGVVSTPGLAVFVTVERDTSAEAPSRYVLIQTELVAE